MTTVSMVVATYNRTPLLWNSLTALADKTWPDELIVVDDGGDDGCEGICGDLRASTGMPIRYAYNHRPYDSMAAQARNAGLKMTDCDWILSAEPECQFESDVVAQFHAYRDVYPNELLNAGTVHHEHPDWNPPQITETVNWQALWVCFYARDWVLSVGGYDEGFPSGWSWDDVDLGTRLFAAGHGQRNLTDVHVLHQWHPHRGMDQSKNEAHFRAKMKPGANGEDQCMEVVANQGREWGVLIPRP